MLDNDAWSTFNTYCSLTAHFKKNDDGYYQHSGQCKDVLVGNNGDFKFMTMESDGKEIPITYWEDKVIDGIDECILKVKNYNNID
jgi:hypothetical protein